MSERIIRLSLFYSFLTSTNDIILGIAFGSRVLAKPGGIWSISEKQTVTGIGSALIDTKKMNVITKFQYCFSLKIRKKRGHFDRTLCLINGYYTAV